MTWTPRASSRGAGILALALASTVAPAPALAAPRAADEPHDEARRRFDRGLALYNRGDAIGALAEFQLAYELTGHPVVLYNLMLVHADLGHAVEAAEAYEQLLASAELTALTPSQAARAQTVYREQRARIGYLEVHANLPQVWLQIDGIDAVPEPSGAVRITAGRHVLGIAAAGHEPQRTAVTIAGESTRVVDVELVPLERELAQLRIASNVPDTDVWIGETWVGRTPATAELLLAAGSHVVEFRRPGYVTERRHLELAPGSQRELAVRLRPSAQGLATRSTLRLRVSEDDAVITLDHEPRLARDPTFALPPGRHHLRVARSGFYDVERDVVIEPGKQRVIDVTLIPQPDYLADYVRRARRQRIAAVSTLAVGSALVVGGGAFLLWNRGEKRDAERAFDREIASVDAAGGCQDPACDEVIDILLDDLEAKRRRDAYGWVGVGLGAASLTTGIVLYALGGDPERYEPSDASDVFGRLSWRIGPGSLTVAGRFGGRL